MMRSLKMRYGNNEQPVISVIVVSYHTRKEFLLNAIKSLNFQTLSRHLFEIIVVKDYADQEIEEMAKESKLFSIILGDEEFQNVGMKFSEGIKVARGTVVTFLEDDDYYDKERLEKIYVAFEKHPDAGLYLNGHYFVYEENSKVSGDSGYSSGVSTFESTTELHSRVYEHINVLMADANSSSIAVRRNLLLPYLTELSMNNNTPDWFIIFCAVDSMHSVILEKRKLTFVTIHSGSLSKTADAGYHFFMNERSKFFLKRSTDFRLISSIMKCRDLRGAALWDMLRYRQWGYIFDRNPRKKEVTENLAETVRYLISHEARPDKLFNAASFTLSSLAYLFFPRQIRFLYYLQFQHLKANSPRHSGS